MKKISMLKAKVKSAVDRPVGQTGLEAIAILLITQGYNMIMNAPDTNSQLVGCGVCGLGIVLMFVKYITRVE